ncbi:MULTISPECIES: SDR family NAD(P)-dependent oxidoreductase [Streptomyces]|uniref:Glucose 1-dehydrogenase n=2 Tax=Streptomyces TaxID=1883 RepID=A0ABS9JTL5_9ACTN|nr:MULTISPECIES: glucose 1-dehydrogenase [Streptomyces]MCG0068895.1 glucose 1-dehydrogenase [Streptomyces tricolor]OYP10402.1 3-oxoacyl-ACP reductase [Streptomyces sp. FBKL.4005]BCM64676.1 ketoreductase [Streptomyces sp. EAS-AB2608]
MPARGLLHGKTVLITGASSGIGAAAAELFAREEARVVLAARREDRLLALVDRIGAAGGQAAAVVADVTRAEDMHAAVARAVERFGSLDAAFNNAGWTSTGTPLHLMDDAEYDRIMDVNARGVWNAMRAQIPVMLESGGGSIVNTSSVAGLRATGSSAPYIAAKHAVIGLSRAAADEYAAQRIRVNALAVGSTRTELMDQVLADTPALWKPFTERAIQQRLADPVEIAQTAAWLCSDRSSFTTGAVIPADGGWTAR